MQESHLVLATLSDTHYDSEAYSRVPQELYDHIFSQLDKRSLKACTLICRRWLVPAQAKLFRSLVQRDNKRTIESFIDFIRSSSEGSPVQYINNLTLIGDAVGSKPWRSYGGWARHGVTANDIGLLLSKLSSLRNLALEHITLDGSVSSWPKITLKTLHVATVACSLTKWSDGLPEAVDDIQSGIIDTLNLFSFIDTLRLENVAVFYDHPWRTFKDGPFDHSAIISALRPKLSRDLRVGTLVYRNIHEQDADLLSMISNVQVENLLIEASTLYLDPFLLAIGHNLQDLHLFIWSDPPAVMSSCRQLLRLHLTDTVPKSRRTGVGINDSRILDYVLQAPPTITCLTVDLNVDPHYGEHWVSELKTFKWKALDDMLDDLSDRISVACRIYPTAQVEQCQQTIPALLPRLHAKGFLQFQWKPLRVTDYWHGVAVQQ